MHTAYLLVSCRSDLRDTSVVEDDDRTVLAKPVQQQGIDVVHPLAKGLHEDQRHARLPAHAPVGIARLAGLDVLRDDGGVSVNHGATSPPIYRQIPPAPSYTPSPPYPS